MAIDQLKNEERLLKEEISDLKKELYFFKEEIVKKQREKGRVEDDILDAVSKKKVANEACQEAGKKVSVIRNEIREMESTKKSVLKSTEDLLVDAEKREADLTAKQDEISEIKASTLELNQIAKTKVQDATGLRVELEKQIGQVKKAVEDKVEQESRVETLSGELRVLKEEAVVILEEAQDKNKEADELKIDAQVILKECQDEKEKYIALNRGLEVKGQEKNSLITKSQAIIKNLQERELKVRQDESMNEATAKSLKVERDRVALKEAKVAKILETLIKDKKIEDTMKELGLGQ